LVGTEGVASRVAHAAVESMRPTPLPQGEANARGDDYDHRADENPAVKLFAERLVEVELT
jgi:hypothetical protein